MPCAQREVRQQRDGRSGRGAPGQQVGRVQHGAGAVAACLRHDERRLEPAVRVHGHAFRRHDVATMLQLDRHPEALSHGLERSADRDVVEHADGARAKRHERSNAHRHRRAVHPEGRCVHHDVRRRPHVDRERAVGTVKPDAIDAPDASTMLTSWSATAGSTVATNVRSRGTQRSSTTRSG